MTRTSDDKRAEVCREVDAFLDAPTTMQTDVEMLLNSLRHRPHIAPIHDPLPMDEVEERLQLASQVSTEITTWRAIDISILMAIPLHTVRRAAADDQNEIEFGNLQQFVRMGR